MKLDFSQGLNNFAGAIQGAGVVAYNQAIQKQQQIQQKQQYASQVKYQGAAAKFQIDLLSEHNRKIAEIESSWNTPGFDRESAADNFMADMEAYYQDVIAPNFTETQRAQFEADILYPLLGEQKLLIENKLADMDIQEGRASLSLVIDSAGDLVSRRMPYKEVLANTMNSIDQLYEMGGYATEAEYQQKKTNTVTDLNKRSLLLQLSDIIGSSDITSMEAKSLIDAVNTGNASLAGQYSQTAQEMIDRLQREEGIDLFTMDDADVLKSTVVSMINEKNNQADRVFSAEVADITSKLTRMNAESPVKISDVKTLFDGKNNRYANQAYGEWLEIAKKNEDNGLSVAMHTQLGFVKRGLVDVEDFITDSRWENFHDEEFGAETKEKYISEAKNHHDTLVIKKITQAFESLSPEEIMNRLEDQSPDDTLSTSGIDEEKAAYRSGDSPQEQNTGIFTKADLRMFDSLYNQDLAASLKKDLQAQTSETISDYLKTVQTTIDQEQERRQTSNYIDLERQLSSSNISPAMKRDTVYQAFLSGDISKDQYEDLLRVAKIRSDKPEYKAAQERIAVWAKAAAQSDPTKTTLTPEERLVADQYEQMALKALHSELDQNPDQVTGDFITSVVESITNTEPLMMKFIQTTYGDTSQARNWHPGGEDFDSFINLLNNGTQYAGPQIMAKAYEMAKVGAMQALSKEFGDLSFRHIQNDQGPLFVVDNPPDKIAEAFKSYYADMFPGEPVPDIYGTRIFMQYIPDGETTSLSIGYKAEDENGYQRFQWFKYVPEDQGNPWERDNYEFPEAYKKWERDNYESPKVYKKYSIENRR